MFVTSHIRRNKIKTLIQFDFDGTITIDDISYGILDKYADKSWLTWADKYHRGEINVGEFNSRVFCMVKQNKETLMEYTRQHSKLRPGFKELLDYCNNKGIEVAIVSNGLDFYIDAVLNEMGLKNILTYSGKSEFGNNGITVRYIGPSGKEMMYGFKEAYTKLFKQQGYQIYYVGNGISDIPAARLSDRIFARDDLLTHCREANLECIPFDDFKDIIKSLAVSEG